MKDKKLRGYERQGLLILRQISKSLEPTRISGMDRTRRPGVSYLGLLGICVFKGITALGASLTSAPSQKTVTRHQPLCDSPFLSALRVSVFRGGHNTLPHR